MSATPEVLAAIRAALDRVHPALDPHTAQIEIAWILREIRYDEKGAIVWRSFELGRRFFDRLGEAQNWRCCYCGIRMLNISNFKDEPTLEHVIPKSKKGPDHPDNLVIACFDCNQTAADLCFTFLKRVKRA